MNVLLWVLQILLASWNLIGGIYTVLNFEEIRGPGMSALPKPAWIAIGVLQALFALGLVVPKLTPIAAVYLAFNALLGCALFAQYAGFPGMLWGVAPGVLTAFVAYGRMRP